MSKDYSVLLNTNYPAELDIDVSLHSEREGTHWAINIDNEDYVRAGDINVLLDSMIAIQNVLGIAPQGSAEDIKERLDDLDTHDHDLRYGGVNWDSTQTILGHVHDGDTGASLINLSNHVTGKLTRDFIAKGSEEEALTSSDFIVPGTGMTITQTLDTKLSGDSSLTLAGFIQGSQLRSTTTSISPLTVQSSTMVNNLNAELLAGEALENFVLSPNIDKIIESVDQPDLSQYPGKEILWIQIL